MTIETDARRFGKQTGDNRICTDKERNGPPGTGRVLERPSGRGAICSARLQQTTLSIPRYKCPRPGAVALWGKRVCQIYGAICKEDSIYTAAVTQK